MHLLHNGNTPYLTDCCINTTLNHMKAPEKGRPEAPPLFNRLAVLRTERGLSRQALAEALQVNYQTVGYLERGEYNPSLDLAFRISELFGVPVEAVFSRTPFTPLSTLLYGRAPTPLDEVRD
jgi:putative transcriptional regulator